MGQILALQFQFQGSDYYTLIRVKQVNGVKELHVTIMDNELQRKLGDNNIFHIKGKKIRKNMIDSPLQDALLRTISHHYNIPQKQMQSRST
ncbi:MAG TPA: hypothetical protein VIK74_05600 [Parasegetibacter sp.]|jgi:hypothetical protein